MMLNLLFILQSIVPEYSKSAHAQRSTGVPEGILYIAFTALLILIVVVSVILTVKFFIHPGETNPNHIKYRVLHDKTHRS